jgi:hypothetical protein
MNASAQAEPIPSLGTYEQFYKASSQLKSGLRLYKIDWSFLVESKTASNSRLYSTYS